MTPTIDELARLGRIMYRLLAEKQESRPWPPVYSAYADASDTDLMIDGTVDLKPGEAALVRRVLARRGES